MAVRRRRRTRGGSIRSWLSNANKWLRKHKVISKGSKFLSDVGVGGPYTANVAKYSGKLGYGTSRAGGALRRAGAGRRVRRRRRCR